MKLTVIGSSSAGNCYILQDEHEALILEAGIRLDKVKQALGFNTRKVVGCLVTHAHGDHSGRAKEFESVFQIYANSHVIAMRSLSRAVTLKSEQIVKVGRFTVYPFTAAHDIPCLGFFIIHPEIGRLLFLTDSFICEYRFTGLNHVLIECNYSDEALAVSGANDYMKKRLMTTHMELKTCAKYLSMNDLSNVVNIVLLHLSKDNSDEQQFIDTLSRTTGKEITIAKSGLVLDINKEPF